jgi:hypothetical protein
LKRAVYTWQPVVVFFGALQKVHVPRPPICTVAAVRQ